jgi:tRNA dimethylallyltransferase
VIRAAPNRSEDVGLCATNRQPRADGVAELRLRSRCAKADNLPKVATLPPLLVIAGPTATGKTGLSLRLVEALGDEGVLAEVISADSRQVYRGLDIGTAKVSANDRARVPHYGLDLVEPDEPFSVADFVEHARTALAGIAERGGIALLVGGTGLYLRSIARGIDTGNLPYDPDVRARIEEEMAVGGVDAAARRLQELAPTASAGVDLRNPRRVARALEIAEIVGDSPRPTPVGYAGPVAWLGLQLDPAPHREWIASRAQRQFDAGLIDEARRLRERFDPSLPAFSAIGYREAWSVLDGELTCEAAIAEDSRRNIAFAKRQRTWFRSEREIVWLDALSDPLEDALRAANGLVDRG